MRIAIYSGSFNPVHNGHLQLAEYVIDHGIADQVWMLVSPGNPLKPAHGLIDKHSRLEMLQLAVASNILIKASDFEFHMPVPSYTIDTLLKLEATYPQHLFSLLIGSDNAEVFDQWKDYNQLLDHFPVLVYPRKGHSVEAALERFPKMQKLETPFYEISSTEIRNHILDNEYRLEWLHPDVVNYIKTHHLYR